jgi:hypothetical protein
MDSVNVQIYKIDIGILIFVKKKKKLILIEILRKLFFTCNIADCFARLYTCNLIS